MNEVTFVNLNHHDLRILTQNGDLVTIPTSGVIARVDYTDHQVEPLNGISVVEPQYGQIIGLPDPRDNTYYIVSSKVRAALGNTARPDVLCAHNIEKDKKGTPKYARGLRRFN